MRKLIIVISVLCSIAVACKKKEVTKTTPLPSNDPDPSKGTCNINGQVQNFDSCNVAYFSSGSSITIRFFKQGTQVLSFNCNNYNSNNPPTYLMFPSGVGTFTYNAWPGSFTGNFFDLSSNTSGSVSNGNVSITAYSQVTGRSSGTFNNVNANSFTNSYLLVDGQFSNVRTETW